MSSSDEVSASADEVELPGLRQAIVEHNDANAEAAPDFDDLWSRAAQSANRRKRSRQRRRWAGLAAVASFLVVALLFWRQELPEPDPQPAVSDADANLFFDHLAGTTHWQAPSDVFLDQQQLHVWGLPELNWSLPETSEQTL